MSTQFLKQFDSYVLRATRNAVQNIQMPLPTDTDVIITGFQQRPLYNRGDISDVSNVGREMDDDGSTTAPTAPTGSGINAPLGTTHYGSTVYSLGATIANLGAFHQNNKGQIFFVIGHSTPAGEQITPPTVMPAGGVKSRNYLSKLKKGGRGGQGYI